jgi:hypothetical protein
MIDRSEVMIKSTDANQILSISIKSHNLNQINRFSAVHTLHCTYVVDEYGRCESPRVHLSDHG